MFRRQLDTTSAAPFPKRQRPRIHPGWFLLISLLLGLFLFTTIIGPWPIFGASRSATSNPNPAITPPAWLKPQQQHTPPPAFPYHYVKPDPNYRYTPQAHAWPVTMKPTTLSLTTHTVHFLSNDQRLELTFPAGAIDSTALQAAGGSMTLKITQLLPGAGGLNNEHIFFGTYQFQFLTSTGSGVTNLTLLHPITLVYHLSADQATLVWYGQKVYAILRDGDASTLLPGTPPTVPTSTSQSTASQMLYATPDSTGLAYSVSSNLTGTSNATQPFALNTSSITFGTQAPQALWGTPQNSQVDLNSGGLMYAYPLGLPPGPGGFAPSLALRYTSGSVDESHNLQAGAPWVGEGWNLSLGSITWNQENVTPGGTNHIENVWTINDPSGISGQLIPPNLSTSTISPYSPALNSLGTGTIWHSAPESHAKIQEIKDQSGTYPCFRVYLPNGVMEEFGCNDSIGSDQSFKNTSGNWNRYRWDLDLITDRYGNQIHFHYQRIWDSTHSWIRDAQLSDIEYDDPTCHNTTTACSTWNPQVKIVFDASTVVQNLLNSLCKGWSNTGFRCDAPVDLSGSGGLPAPKVLNSYVLNDVKVEVQGNILRQYVFSYTQAGPQTITDPLTGQKESSAGYFNLNQIQEDGTQGTALNAPVINLSYQQLSLHYSDEWKYSTPTNNCSPDSWSPKDGNGACYLWSRTYSTWYLTTIDNGEGWDESISYLEEHTNTHGVDSGAIDEPATCNAIRTSTNRCGKADDKNWSHYAVVNRADNTNGETSTWSYKYWLQTGLPINYVGSVCDECTQGFTWGNQNDNDYADYYNGQFESYFRVQVNQPDGSYQAHIYATTTGWGLAESSITCYISSCQVAPYSTNQGSLNATALAGRELIEYDFDASNNLLAVHTSTYTPDCQPTGFPVTGGGPPNNPGDHYLISQLDQNNPVVVCDPRITQDDSYQVDGVTDLNHYTSDARVVHRTSGDSYDTDNQGVSAYDYGNLSNTDTTGNDVGGTHIVAHSTFYPNDNVPGNVFLTNLPAIMQTRDSSGTPVSCSQAIYQNNSSVTTSPSLPGVSQQQAYTKAGSGGCTGSGNLITTLHTYDSSGNPITGIDADNHLGCTSGSNQYSACAVYDSSTYDTHLTSAVNAKNQSTGYAYTTGSSGGYSQWLTSTTDPNSQTTSYQYDVLGRLVATIRPGDSSGSPSVNYSYSNSCSNGKTSPCIELDTSSRFTVGGPTSTVKHWYDGQGRLIETQSPSPVSGQTIISYTVYYNDSTNGVEVVKSLPYAVAPPSGYISPDLTQARSVSKSDGLGRSEGSVTYSDATTIVLSASLSYLVAQGVTGLSSENNTAYEQTTTLDAYNHQSINYRDAFGRTRFDQLFSGTTSPYSVARTIEYSYDVLGNTLQTQTFDGNATLQASYSATFDALQRRTGLNDSDLGSCSNTPLPASCSGSSDTAWKFTYDADGNMLSQIDPRNQGTYTSYDNLDRQLCRATQSNPCSNSPYALYFYDSYNNNSNPGQTFPSGCTAPSGSYASDPTGHVTAEAFSSSVGNGWRCSGYDQRGELDQSLLSITADGTTTTQQVNLSYNDGGEVTALVYPDSETITSQFNNDGYLLSSYFGTSSTPDPVNFLISKVSYTNAGLNAGLSIGGSGPKNSTPSPVFTTSYGYDGIQRAVSSQAQVSSNTIWSQARTYDNVGNVLQLSATVPLTGGGTQSENQSFCYDALNRLVWAGNTGTPAGGDHCGNTPTGATLPTYQQSFSYDTIDRMTSGPSGGMTYDSNHVHAAITANSFPNQYAAYDAMGNMTCRNVDTTSAHTCSGGSPTGASMTYDNEGRLVSWSAPSGTTATDAFLYDNEGNRVLQRTNDSTGVTDTITFDGYTEIVMHGGTTTSTRYYSANGQRVGMKTSNTLYYLVNDSLGGASLVLKSDASVQAVQLFAPYGATRYSQGTMPTTYNFTGQRLDSETGLLYYNFRYYDPLSGRFARADTVQSNAGGKDSYAYVANNPETKDDPTGHKDCTGCYQYWHKSNGPLPLVDYLALAAPLGLLLLFGLGGLAITAVTTAVVADTAVAGVVDATGTGVADASATASADTVTSATADVTTADSATSDVTADTSNPEQRPDLYRSGNRTIPRVRSGDLRFGKDYPGGDTINPDQWMRGVDGVQTRSGFSLYDRVLDGWGPKETWVLPGSIDLPEGAQVVHDATLDIGEHWALTSTEEMPIQDFAQKLEEIRNMWIRLDTFLSGN